jgi:hypothetical protein
VIPRDIEPLARRRFADLPVLTVTGPRQSGKTTLVQRLFPHLRYVSLEDPDAREAAQHDARAFLGPLAGGAIFDEVQRVPDLASYLQGMVDNAPRRNGRFVLTGSQNFAVRQALSQSLAGRTAILGLLPPAHPELLRFEGAPTALFETLRTGAYPRIHDHRLPPHEFLADYVSTYVERDVRQVLQVGDLAAFQTFLRLCAGRSGQMLNAASLGADAGVTAKTVRSWLSVLETSYIVTLLQPWHANTNKRLVRSPKLYFLDTGLLCYLLGIRTDEQLQTHPLRGAIFETWVIAEIIKARANRGERERLLFYREHSGTEIDAVVELPDRALAVEIKSGQRVPPDGLAAFDRFAETYRQTPLARAAVERIAVHGGAETTRRGNATLLSWRDVGGAGWV